MGKNQRTVEKIWSGLPGVTNYERNSKFIVLINDWTIINNWTERSFENSFHFDCCYAGSLFYFFHLLLKEQFHYLQLFLLFNKLELEGCGLKLLSVRIQCP